MKLISEFCTIEKDKKVALKCQLTLKQNNTYKNRSYNIKLKKNTINNKKYHYNTGILSY